MSLLPNSIAAATAASVVNKQFQTTSENLQRIIGIIGTYDPAKTLVVAEVPVLITSSADAGDQFGFGTMIHRLAVQTELGAQGIPTYVIPQAEAGGAVVAEGDFDYAGSTGVLAGTHALYIAGLPVPITVTDAMTADELATAAAAAITADIDLPATAVVNGVTASQVDVTSRSKGPWGNDITISFNRRPGDVTPIGITVAVTPMASGAGTPDIGDALNGMGINDDANEIRVTDVVQGYGQVTTELDLISTYVGPGNIAQGTYSKTVGRPFRVLTGDVAAGSAGLTALLALGALRKQDRANGVLAVPGSKTHPGEIAAQAIGHMARVNSIRAAESFEGIILTGVDPGDTGTDRWTSDYPSRDAAVKAGISTTKVVNGSVVLQDLVTFYHPDNVPSASNAYRHMRNIAIIQNILNSILSNFEQEKWQGISIVSDTRNVTNSVDREKARDTGSVRDDLVALAKSWAGKAWIYSSEFTINALKEAGSVVIRAGGQGFDGTTKVRLSGVGTITDMVTEVDADIPITI